MPQLVAAFLLITLASIALPGMNGFVGEFLILLGAFSATVVRPAGVYTAVAATGVILSAVYMLWMFQRVNYGPVTNAEEPRPARSERARVVRHRAGLRGGDLHGRGAGRVPEADGGVGQEGGRAHRRHGAPANAGEAGRRPGPRPHEARGDRGEPQAGPPSAAVLALTAMLMSHRSSPSRPCSSSRCRRARCCWPSRSAGRTRRCRSGWLGVIGLVGAIVVVRVSVGPRAHRVRRHRRRQLHALLQHHDLRDRAADDSAVVGDRPSAISCRPASITR